MPKIAINDTVIFFLNCHNSFRVLFDKIASLYRVGQKTGLFFRLDNFVTVSPRKACSMSKFSKFYREKGTKLAFQ